MVEPDAAQGGARCAQCGHFVGPVPRCPHCGARLEARMALKRLRGAAFAVALAGLVLLHLYAKHGDLPLVEIGRITPMMNFAAVRVEGWLESDARTMRSGAVLYVVSDGTGTLSAFLEGGTGDALPKAGSRVRLSGSLGVGAGGEARLRAHAAEVLGTAEAAVSRKGERLAVRGRVSRVWTPPAGSKAPHRIVLAAPGGALDVVHWFAPVQAIKAGDTLEVCGTVDAYRDAVRLKVWSAADLRRVEE